jgi:origin recognition complex subunit 4
MIKQTFYTTRSLPEILSALYIPIASLNIHSSTSTSKPTPKTKPSKSKSAKSTSHTSPSTSKPTSLTIPPLSPPSIPTLLPTLPILHLSLLIAAARLETLYALTSLNFNAAYTHYTDLLTRSRLKTGRNFGGGGARSWSRDVCRQAWEDLASWGLLLPVHGRGDGEGLGGREEVGVRMVRVDVGLDEVAWGVKEKFAEEGGGKGVAELLGRWCKEE